MPPQPRSLSGYLALPRPGDSVKWLILPSGFLMGAMARGDISGQEVFRAVLVWFALEFLVYQARYQWNDIRGFEADQRHPDGDRGRLPGPLDRGRQHKTWSASAAAVKVLLAVVIAWALGGTAGTILVIAGTAVFLVALAYEGLRATSTGRTGVVPSPLTPGVVAIWLVVGGGYAIRILAGLSLAVDMWQPPALGLFAAVGSAAFGIAWVTSRWAIEATAFARLDGHGLSWLATAQHAREHQLALVRWLPTRADLPSGDTSLGQWRAVRGVSRPDAPWHVAALLAGGAATATGGLLGEPDLAMGTIWLLVMMGVLATAGLIAAGRRRSALFVPVLGLLLFGLSVLGAPEPLPVVLPWLMFSISQTMFLRQDRDSLGALPRRLSSLGQRAPSRVSTRRSDTEASWISTS